MASLVKQTLAQTYKFMSSALLWVGFRPLEAAMRIRATPSFIQNLIGYTKQLPQNSSFPLKLSQLHFATYDRYQAAGSATGHYFWQDLWAAKRLYENKITHHVDVGSRIDGFVAHILPFCSVTYVDVRPLRSIEGLSFKAGTITSLPFDSDSIPSISSLHVIEHIGLGRYGDEVDPEGHLKAAQELVRVLKPGGRLFIGTPVGKQRLQFDAHRIFDPQTVVKLFQPLKLVEFSLVNDLGDEIRRNVALEEGRLCSYGCGLFEFMKIAE